MKPHCRYMFLLAVLLHGSAQATAQGLVLPDGVPQASIDLGNPAELAQLNAQWRYHDVQIIETPFKAAGTDQQPSGKPVITYTVTPQAGARDFDDSSWQVIPATSLSDRRGNGRLSFNWYRLRITIPDRIGNFDPTGFTLVLETSVDDYAEVWVDGELPRAEGQHGGSIIAGWNAVNRLVIGRAVQPGQQIQLALFGSNGPLSNPPTNYIYVRHAKLEFHPGGHTPYAVPPHEVNIEVQRLDPALDSIVPANPKLFKLAEGFQFTEGPVWVGGSNPHGHLLFSDPNANTLYRYSDEEGLTVFKHPSGYAGADIADYKQPGSNGLALDAQGRLTINQHGNRQIIRIEADGRETVLADRFDGKRLNSPNDLVYKSDGSLYFTDPYFGLPKLAQDPRKELPFSGIYRVRNSKVELLEKELNGPNGIAFSPDERYLYVGNWDQRHKVVKRYPVLPDGRLGSGEVFFDMTRAPGDDAIDGIKIDRAGNLYVSGPGGLWILAADGRHLGTLLLPRHPHNMAWGGADRKTLYLAAQNSLYRMPLLIPGQ